MQAEELHVIAWIRGCQFMNTPIAKPKRSRPTFSNTENVLLRSFEG